MKTVLAFAAAFGFSASAALAGCPGHVSASVDKETVVASIDAGPVSTPADADKMKEEKAE